MTVFTAQLRQEIQVGYPRIRSFSKDFRSSFALYVFYSCLNISPPQIMVFVFIIIIFFSDIFANKEHVSPKLSLVNVPGLNYLLRSEIFASEDGQLRVAHLILDYKPISRIFQDAGQALRAGNSKLVRIDVSKPVFLAQRDLPPVQLPIRHVPQEVTIPRKETTSVQLSLEAEVDQFRLEDEGVAD